MLSCSPTRSGLCRLTRDSTCAIAPRPNVRVGVLSVRECVKSDTCDIRDPAASLKAAVASASVTGSEFSFVSDLIRPIARKRKLSDWDRKFLKIATVL